MDIEYINEKQEFKNYIEDMKAEKEIERLEREEIRRREWAQQNGNDSGYDPYCDCEYE